MKKETNSIDIRFFSILKVLLALAAVYFLYLINHVLFIVFVSFIFASAFDPIIDKLHRYKIPRALSILIIYLILLSILVGIVVLFIPILVTQTKELAVIIPQYYEIFVAWLSNILGDDVIKDLPGQIQGIGKGLVGQIGQTLLSGAQGIVTLIAILVLVFYITIEENSISQFFKAVAPTKYQPYFSSLLYRIQRRLGYWLIGQMTLSFIIFVLILIGLLILDVKYALTLALLAGLLEVIPAVGPTLAAIPAILIAFSIDPIKGLAVTILYVVVQQMENHWIVPKVMGKSVGLNSLVIIISILIGATLGGVIGALLSVPVMTVIAVMLEDLFETKAAAERQLIDNDNE